MMVYKIMMLMRSYSCWVYYRFKLLFFFGFGFEGYRNDIEVSLTSYGERLDSVFLTIGSLMNQSVSPASINLWLYKGDLSCGKIPKKLLKLKKKGLKIHLVDENLRSYKKIVHHYEDVDKSSVRYIVTVDDDVYYPRRWLENIVSCIEKDPEVVWCYRGRIVSFNSSYNAKDYNEWPIANRSMLKKNNLLPIGVSGVCYPVDSLLGVNDRKSFLAYAPTADDLWLKFVTTSNGYVSSLVGEKSLHFPPVINSFSLPKKGLEKENVIEGRNNKSFTALLKLFSFSSSDF